MNYVRIPSSLDDDAAIRQRDVLFAALAGVLIAGASLRWLDISGALVAGLITASVAYVIASWASTVPASGAQQPVGDVLAPDAGRPGRRRPSATPPGAA